MVVTEEEHQRVHQPELHLQHVRQPAHLHQHVRQPALQHQLDRQPALQHQHVKPQLLHLPDSRVVQVLQHGNQVQTIPPNPSLHQRLQQEHPVPEAAEVQVIVVVEVPEAVAVIVVVDQEVVEVVEAEGANPL